MKTVHVKEIIKWKPCIDPLSIVSSDWEGTALDVLALDNLTASDKLWVVLRPEFLNDKTFRLFAVACARSVEHLLTDKRSKKAIEVAERYAHGKASDAELEAARAAAARADAAVAAAAAATWAALAAAATWAARSARSAAEAAEVTKEKQVKMLIELINKWEKEE